MAIEDEGSGMKKRWLALIHIAQMQLNLTDEAYRSILRERYGVKSAKKLTPAQGKDLIDHFKYLGFVPVRRNKICKFCIPRPKRDTIPTNTIYPVSPAQKAKIERLKKDIKWKTFDGFSRWLRRYFKIEEIRTSVEASSVIFGLLRLWRSEHKCHCSLIKKGM